MRVDFRVNSSGAPFIIDVNPNPLSFSGRGRRCTAAEAGASYQELIGRIVESALGFSQARTYYSQAVEISIERDNLLRAYGLAAMDVATIHTVGPGDIIGEHGQHAVCPAR